MSHERLLVITFNSAIFPHNATGAVLLVFYDSHMRVLNKLSQGTVSVCIWVCVCTFNLQTRAAQLIAINPKSRLNRLAKYDYEIAKAVTIIIIFFYAQLVSETRLCDQ